MRIAKGNLFQSNADRFVITTNGIVKANGRAVMGAGIAKYARDTYPGVDLRLGNLLNRKGNHVFDLGYNLVSFPTKHNWKQDSDLDLIVRSATELALMADAKGWEFVAMPPVGCGMGRLNWSDVEAAISPHLDNRFTVYRN